jgi:hypothetical protein
VLLRPQPSQPHYSSISELFDENISRHPGGFALIALAIISVSLAGRAGAQDGSQARFTISAAQSYWTLLDVETGEIR